MKQKALTRRRFLAKAGAIIAAPYFIPAAALGRAGRPAPSNRITLGCIGLGYQGTRDMQGFLANADVQVLAVCDVDRHHAENAQGIINDWYAKERASGAYKDCRIIGDFRELISRPDIDALLIVTPDHWHAIPVIEGAKAGKDMYCEKPLSLTVEEGRAMCNAVKRYNRIFQTGTQLRSMSHTRFACELVRNGRIGKVHTVRVGSWGSEGIPPQPVMPVPEWFDYDFWLGQAPWAPYTEKRCHWNFRYNLDYSGGDITDHGVHSFDIIQWALGTQYTGPVEIEGTATYPKSGLYTAATSTNVHWRYANGIEMLTDKNLKGDDRIEGDEGWVSIGQGAMDASPRSLLKTVFGPDEIHLYESGDHIRNFLDCVKTREEPLAPCEIGHRSTSIPLLANIAIKMGRKLGWNPETEHFVNDPEADRHLSRVMRAPWHL